MESLSFHTEPSLMGPEQAKIILMMVKCTRRIFAKKCIFCYSCNTRCVLAFDINCWSKAYVCFYLYQSLRLDFGQPPAAAGCLGSLPLPTSAVISPHSLMETIVKLQRNRSRKTTDQEEIMIERSLCKGKPTATSINSIFLDSVVFIAVDCL